MKKHFLKHSALTMKRAFTKTVFALCFVLIFASIGEMNAQSSLTQANPHEKIAERIDVDIIPEGSIDLNNAITVLNNQLETVTKGNAMTIEYRYYWLVTVDVNRFNVPLEEALINNLMEVQNEFDASTEDLQTLYQTTVNML